MGPRSGEGWEEVGGKDHLAYRVGSRLCGGHTLQVLGKSSSPILGVHDQTYGREWSGNIILEGCLPLGFLYFLEGFSFSPNYRAVEKHI